MNVNLKALVGKLTDSARKSLSSAAAACSSRTQYEVEPEHWLLAMLEAVDGDCARICRSFQVDPMAAHRQLEHAVGLFKTGNSRTPSLSPDIEQMLQGGWIYASIEHGLQNVRTGTIFLASLLDASLRRRFVESAPILDKVNPAALAGGYHGIVGGSPEDKEITSLTAGADRAVPTGGAKPASSTPALDQYTVDLTVQAAAGKIDPVLGRDAEIRQIVDILTRRRQNNPILTGEAGVGKTAVVEGFALRVVQDDVPLPLRGVAVRTLDLGLLQAGAGVKGEFENRLKQVIEEVRASAKPIILFIDEAHTMIGAGGQAGQNDAANLLKPALARGELRTIAATTWAEYKKFFEKDAALSRRFQVVKVDEPGEDGAIQMMRGVAGKLGGHHKVRVLDEAIVDSVRLSSRYLPARQLPDKSVSVLDTACARVSVGQHAVPADIEDRRHRVAAFETELEILDKEQKLGADHSNRIAERTRERDTIKKALAELEARWNKEKELVARIHTLRTEFEKSPEAGKNDAKKRELEAAQTALKSLQGESPLMPVDVDSQTVASVISAWTGIPIGKMLADQIQAVLNLPERLRERIIGQDHALEAVGKRIKISRAKMDNPSRPIGVFLLVGPSGVGKTETALALSEALYGGERNLITINMSEYQEPHSVSKLKGSPPGYVGYGEGGVLTEAVRRRPYAVVLLDEVEKAHPDIMEIFYQVFDKGRLEDGEGREIDFKNTVILLTSNIGSETISTLCKDPETLPDPEPLAEAIRPELRKQFPPALLGRMVIVPYYPILPAILRKIVELQLKRIVERVRVNHAATMSVDPKFVDWVIGKCTESETGARNVDRILTQGLLPRLATEVLQRMAGGKAMKQVAVGIGTDGDLMVTVAD